MFGYQPDRYIQIPEESIICLFLCIGRINTVVVSECRIYDRTIHIGYSVHDLHFQNLRYCVDFRVIDTGRVFQFIYLRKDIGIGISPVRSVPSVLQVIIGIAASTVMGFIIVHIPAEHICIQILHNLVRPVLSLSEIIIKIDSLLNDSQRNTQIIEIDSHILIGDSGLVCIHLLEMSRTGWENQEKNKKEGCYLSVYHLHTPELKITFYTETKTSGGRHTVDLYSLIIISR